MRRALPVLILALALGSLSARAQSGKESASASGDQSKPSAKVASSGGFSLPKEKAQPVNIPRFDKPPLIDGKLDDEVWKSAAVLKDFYQTQPGDNIAPSQQTRVLLGYDASSLYVGFYAYDDPSKVRATVCRRDNVFDDDTVRIFLDTYNDKRKAYVLAFNPLGVQADGIMSEDRGEDYSVDIVMESKGGLTQDGYIVEVAIPFKSLRYEAGKDRLWGLHASRQIRRLDNEVDSWMPISRDSSGFLNQEGHITGLEGISTARSLEIIPTFTLIETGRRVRTLPSTTTLSDPGRFVNQPIHADPGVSVKLGITRTITLDFTANPDFAQVEADQPVITANERFPIFFEEKRPFFLEGIDIFQTPLRVVHTRAIVDPDYAVKLSGKQGRSSFGILMASDNAPGNFSEEERNDPELLPDIARFLDKNALIGVVRLKRDVGKENSIGFIGTSYNFIEKHNQVAGVDGRFRVDKQTTFNFQMLGTASRLESDRAENGFGYSFIWDNTGRNFGYALNGSGLTRKYRSDVGFVRQTNINNEGFGFRLSNDPKPKATLITVRLNNFFYTSFDWQSHMKSLGESTNLGFTFARNIFFNLGFENFHERIFEEEFGAKRTAGEPGAFFGDDPERSVTGHTLYCNFNMNPSKKYSARFFVGHRWNVFDFDFGAGPRFPRVSPAALADPSAPLDPGAANTVDVNASFTYQPTSALNASIDYSRSRFTRNETGRVVFIDNIYSLNVRYQFGRYTFVRARADYDSLSSSLRGQYLFGWTPNPGTSLYVGYNDDLNHNGFSPFTGQHERGFHRNGRTFFIKTSYLIRRNL